MTLLGIEIGGTKLQVAAGDQQGNIQAIKRSTVRRQAGAQGILADIQDLIAQLASELGEQQFSGVGVGFGGPVDSREGRVITSHQIAGWSHFPLRTWFEQQLGLPAFIGNDADVAGLAEAILGGGKGKSRVFYVTVGSGIGGGFILEGNLYQGVRGAAELGHLLVPYPDEPGKLVTVESLASGWGMEAWYRSQTNDTLRVPEIALRFDQGDPVAQRVMKGAIEALALSLCCVITLLCPDCIILGGGVSKLPESIFLNPLKAEIEKKLFAPFRGATEILSSHCGEAVVLHGALLLAGQESAKTHQN